MTFPAPGRFTHILVVLVLGVLVPACRPASSPDASDSDATTASDACYFLDAAPYPDPPPGLPPCPSSDAGFHDALDAEVTPASNLFGSPVSFDVASWPFSLLTTDLNRDGKLDIIVAFDDQRTYTPGVSLLINSTMPGSAAPSFLPRVDLTIGSAADAVSKVVLLDVNGDGADDLAVPHATQHSVSILLNTTSPAAPAPTFSAPTDFPLESSTSYLSGLVAGDFDSDGRPDVAVEIDAPATQLAILINQTAHGASVPSLAAPTLIPMIDVLPVVADLNTDGKPDLVLPGRTSTPVLLNTTSTGAATVSFSNGGTVAEAPSPTSAPLTGDFNGDGRPDLVWGPAPDITFILNDTVTGSSAATFSARGDFPFHTHGSFQTEVLAVGDINGDGRPDVAVGTRFYAEAGVVPGDAVVLLNATGTGEASMRVSDSVEFTPSVDLIAMAIGDFNGDHHGDLAMVGTDLKVTVLPAR